MSHKPESLKHAILRMGKIRVERDSLKVENKELQAKLSELEGQEPVGRVTANGWVALSTPLPAWSLVYAAAGAAPKGLFIDMIANHEGLAEELKQLDAEPIIVKEQSK